MADAGRVGAEERTGDGANSWSSSVVSDEPPLPADHLVVLVHGILGSTANWKYAAEEFARRLADKVIVHCSERNMNKLSLDGVDVTGERLAEEVIDVIKGCPGLKKISFVAHSVGGLVARYAVGRLYRPMKRRSESQDASIDNNFSGTIAGLKPINFITLATPHLGSRGNKQVPFLFGLTTVENFASRIIHWIFGRTGKHLFLTDDEGKPPLLMRMIDDYNDLYFMSGLRAFQRRVTYSNVDYDHIVGWRTSSIRRHSELPKWEDSLSEKYPHIVYEEQSSMISTDGCIDASSLNMNSNMLEEKLLIALTSLSWERVDVSFHASKQRFSAHSVIQVKDTVSHSEGVDVIKHIIDRFLI